MDRIDAELDAFFRKTEAPEHDEVFVWRVIEEYERRTRLSALIWTAARAAVATILVLVAVVAVPPLDTETQLSVAGSLRPVIGLGCVLAAFAYAGRRLFNHDAAAFAV